MAGISGAGKSAVSRRRWWWLSAGGGLAVALVAGALVWHFGGEAPVEEEEEVAECVPVKSDVEAGSDLVDEPSDGEVQVVEQGLTVHDRASVASFGGVLENSTAAVAVDVRVQFELIDVDGEVVNTGTEERAEYGWAFDKTVPYVLPGERFGLGGTGRFSLDVEDGEELSLQVEVVEVEEWRAEHDEKTVFADLSGEATESNLDFHVHASQNNNVKFALESDYCQGWEHARVSAVFHDDAGSIIGGVFNVWLDNGAQSDSIPFPSESDEELVFRPALTNGDSGASVYELWRDVEASDVTVYPYACLEDCEL